MITGPESEIGRELKWDELAGREDTVVVLRKGGTEPYVTMWLLAVSSSWVQFLAGETNTVLMLKHQSDGILRDDSGTQIHVFEYLPAGGVSQQ